MTTASTKPYKDKPRRADRAGQPPATPGLSELSAQHYWIAAAAILAVAAFLRLYLLDLKPIHHDEGVNGWFLTRLVRDHIYHYDPANYHGPTLYYFALALTPIFGLTDIGLRLTTVLAGLLAVGLVLRMKDTLGAIGALAAAALIATSSGMVFYSRYFIHEMLLICFTLGAVNSALAYVRTRRPTALLATAAWWALVFATKETVIITGAVLVMAAACTIIYSTLYLRLTGASDSPRPSATPPSVEQALPSTVLWWMAAAALFLLISVLFYSSFFTYREGLRGALQTFAIWGKTGFAAHTHSWYTYLEWLWKCEAATLTMGVAGIIVALAFLGGLDRRAIFFAAWAIGITIGYSYVPYKTPWLTLNLLLPLALLAGRAADYVACKLDRLLAICLVCGALAYSLFAPRQTVALNFYDYDDDSYPYVYAHTRRGYNELLREVDRFQRSSGKGSNMGIAVLAPENWPLPWSLRAYGNRAGYYGSVVTPNPDVSLVIAQDKQQAELSPILGSDFIYVGQYALRPGVELILYARRELTIGSEP